MKKSKEKDNKIISTLKQCQGRKISWLNIQSLPEHAYSSVGPQDEPTDEHTYFLMVC